MSKAYILTYSDSGGAGNALRGLCEDINKKGIHCEMIVFLKNSDSDYVIKINSKKFIIFLKKILNRFWDLLKFTNKKYNFYDNSIYYLDSLSEIDEYIKEPPKWIILGWITKLISYKLIDQLARKYSCKIIWSFTDFAPLTGGCHYNWDCKGYLKDCENCPAIFKPFNFIPKRNLKEKKILQSNHNISNLIPANYLINDIKESPLFKHNKIFSYKYSRYILNNEFKPVDNQFAKNKLGICDKKKYILFAANNIDDPRKGSSYLEFLLGYLNSFPKKYRNIGILIVGRGNLQLNKYCNIKILNLGMLNLKDLLYAYNSSYLLFSPILQDFGPATLVQAMLCGLVPLSFNNGIAKDIIKNKKSGLIMFENDTDIINNLDFALNISRKTYDQISLNCIRSIKTYYSLKDDEEVINRILFDFH